MLSTKCKIATELFCLANKQLEPLFAKYSGYEDYKPSQWVEENIVLGSDVSASSGHYSFSIAPYAREIVDTIADYNVKEITMMTSSQVGKTTILIVMMLWVMVHDPSNILFLTTTEKDAKRISEDIFVPILKKNENLVKLLVDEDKKMGDTILKKKYHGGNIYFCSAHNVNDLHGKTIKYLFLDEVSQYDKPVAVSYAKQRTATMADKKIIIASTPTVNGCPTSAAYLSGDQREYNFACPACGHWQPFSFENLLFPGKKEAKENDDDSGTAAVKNEGEKNKNDAAEVVRKPNRETYKYACVACKAEISEEDKYSFLQEGKWIAKEKRTHNRSFHLNEMYACFKHTWKDLSIGFLRARQAIDGLQSFNNLNLGLTWEEEGYRIDIKKIRKEQIFNFEGANVAPEGVNYIFVGVDVQGDRLEGEVVGFGEGYRSFGLEYFVIKGDTMIRPVWDELQDKLLGIKYATKKGTPIKLQMAAIDVNDGRSRASEFVARYHRYPLYWVGVRGVKERANSQTQNSVYQENIYWGRNTKRLNFHARTGALKDDIYSFLQRQKGEPGYMQFAGTDKGYTEKYFKALVSEERVRRVEKGLVKTTYKKKFKHNHALDARVYAYAALRVSQLWSWFDLDEAPDDKEQEAESAVEIVGSF